MKHYVSLIGPLCGVFVPVPAGITIDDLCRGHLRDLVSTIHTEAEVDADIAANRGLPCVKLPDYYSTQLLAGGPLPLPQRPDTKRRTEDYRPSWTGDGPGTVD